MSAQTKKIGQAALVDVAHPGACPEFIDPGPGDLDILLDGDERREATPREPLGPADSGGPMAVQSASAEWNGSLKEGSGKMRAGTGAGLLALFPFIVMFLVTSITMIAPLLLDLARDFDVPVAQTGLLAAVTSGHVVHAAALAKQLADFETFERAHRALDHRVKRVIDLARLRAGVVVIDHRARDDAPCVLTSQQYRLVADGDALLRDP